MVRLTLKKPPLAKIRRCLCCICVCEYRFLLFFNILVFQQTGETRSVRHFWLTCWPVSGRPEPISLVRFVLDSRPQYEDSSAPLVVHCG